MTKHILLAQNTDPNSKLDPDIQNLTGQCGQLAQGADLRADTWGPMHRDDMGPVVESSAVVNDLGSAQGQSHSVPARSEVGQLAKGEQYEE
jgi:hypothetical protein